MAGWCRPLQRPGGVPRLRERPAQGRPPAPGDNRTSSCWSLRRCRRPSTWAGRADGRGRPASERVRHRADARTSGCVVGRSGRDAAAAPGHGWPGAVIRIDSFEGGSLPPKSMIKAIHITRDQFAAENHNAEGLFIDIITQPGWARSGPSQLPDAQRRDDGAECVCHHQACDQVQNYGFNLSGGLIGTKRSFISGCVGTPRSTTPSSQPCCRTARVGLREASLAAREFVLERQLRLRHYPRSDAEAELQPVRHSNRNLGVGGSTCRSARSAPKTTRTRFACRKRAHRPPLLHQHPVERRLDGHGPAFGHAGAPFACRRRSRRAARR
jgi:hypothetical protein